jgi:hypothetical protein
VTWTGYGRPNCKYCPDIYVEVQSETPPKKHITSGPQDDIRHTYLHNTKKMYAVPTQANIPVEFVSSAAMITEGGLGIAAPIVNPSTVLRQVISFTHQPLYFPTVRVPCTNGVGGWASLRAALDRSKK